MSRYGYLGISESPLEFEITRVDCNCLLRLFSHFFFSKNTRELDLVLTRTVNILDTNELVKLTMI